MEKNEKGSPSPSHNIFDAAAAGNLLGMSPFALPYAHLAHIPSAFSLLGHHPAFPVTSLFGGLNEGAFGHLPSSLSSMADGATWLNQGATNLHSHYHRNHVEMDDLFAGSLGTTFSGPLLNLALPHNGAPPLAISIPDSTNSGSTKAEDCSSKKSSSSPRSSPSKVSPKSRSRTSSSSPKTTITKATTAAMTTTTTSFTNSNSYGEKTTITPVSSRGDSVLPGESLLTGKNFAQGKSLLAGRSLLSGKIKRTLKTSSNSHDHNPPTSSSRSFSPSSPPSSEFTSSSLLTSSHKAKKHESNGSSSFETEALKTPSVFEVKSSSSGTPVLSLPLKTFKPVDIDECEKNGEHNSDSEDQMKDNSSYQSDDEPLSKYHRKPSFDDMDDEEMDIDLEKKNHMAPSIHIDGLKKKLIADQIRQRVQSKPIQNVKPSIMQPMKRGRGRPPKNHPDFKEYSEELKQQLETSLRHQQLELKQMKKQQEREELETALKVQQLLKQSEDERKSRGGGAVGRGGVSGRGTTSERHQRSKSQSSMKINQLLSEKTAREERANLSKSLIIPDPLKDDRSLDLTEPLFPHLKAKSEETPDSSNDTNEGSDSDSNDNDSDDNDDNMSELSDSFNDTKGISCSETGSISSKRSGDELSESGLSPAKRPRVQTDERALSIPLEHGWRRHTTILALGKRGFIGEVLYFGPCGKKMKTIPDVMRYLEKNNIKDLGRENFSFTTKVNVGEYQQADPETNTLRKLTDEEVREKLAMVESKRQKMLRQKQTKGSRRAEKQSKQIQLAKQMMEQKMKRKVEQQEMARRAAEYKLQKKLEKQRQKEMAQKIKDMRGTDHSALLWPKPTLFSSQSPQLCTSSSSEQSTSDSKTEAIEKKQQRDHLKLLREQEKIQRQEHLRVERELRAQQILESNLLWYHMEREREMKRQQALIVKEQERERKRQHFILVKALEAQKKQAEKDRLKEDKITEKRMSREKKMEQRRLELQMARELKKPVEDMELKDHRALPDLPRIPGNQLDGHSFADILMVLEFLHNFSDALGYDEETLPTLKSLQDGIMSKTEEDCEDFVSLVSHLLRYAVNDPGVPNPKEATTHLGQKIADVPIMEGVVSEVLRIFMIARNGKSDELSDLLTHQSVETLNISQKASVLSFLVNELLCGRHISTVIEKQLDHMGDIRRDKWVVEGKLRRLSMIQARKYHNPGKSDVSTQEFCANKATRDILKMVQSRKNRMSKNIPLSESVEGDNSVSMDNSTVMAADGEDSISQNISMASKKCSDDEDEKEDDSGNDSGDEQNPGGHEGEGDEDDSMSLEECEKQIDKLQKQHAQYRAKVFKASHKVRAISVGQDRFKRRYWVLPSAGGVYLEGLESGNFDEEFDDPVKKEERKDIKSEMKEEVKQEYVAMETDVKEEKAEIKQEVLERKDILKIPVIKKENFESRLFSSESGCENNEISKSTSRSSEIHSPHLGSKVELDGDSLTVNVTKHNGEESSLVNGEITPKSTSRCSSAMSESSESKSSLFHHKFVKHNDVSSKDAEVADNKRDVKPSISNAHASPLISPYPSAPSPFFPSSLAANPASLLSGSPAHQHTSSSSSSVSSSTPLPAHQHPKTSTSSSLESKPSFLSIDSLLKKENGPNMNNNHFFPSPMFPLMPLNPDHMMKSLSGENGDQKPWFSILPRMPCDDISLTQGSSQISVPPNMLGGTSPFFSPLSFGAFPLHSPAFASFQMGHLFGTPSNLSGVSHDSQQSPQVDDSFKVPDTPRSETNTPSTSVANVTEHLLKDLQGEVQPIPDELQKSWWRITDPEDVRAIQRNCHPRGIREKSLQKSLQKYMDYACESCTKDNKNVCLESEESSEDEEEKEEEKKEEKNGENEEEKQKSKGKKKKKVNKDKQSEEEKEKKPWNFNIGHQVELQALEEVESLEERVASASLQIKGWKVPQRVSEDPEIVIVDRMNKSTKPNEFYPLEIARTKLLKLEPNIERRYLKPPLCKAVQINLANITTSSSNQDQSRDETGEDDEDKPVQEVKNDAPIPAGLQTWRNAVTRATSAAQLTLCAYQLNNAISWEKSIMKVLCQICRKDDNEAQLLLCDGCDQGYHTYCFKPKMEEIPSGDWYCYLCVSKAVGEPCCIVCGKRMGRIVECEHCPRAIHLDCLDPPLPRMPRKWVCQGCSSNQGKKRQRRSPKKKNTENGTRERRDSDASGKNTDTPGEKKRGKDAEKRKQAEQSDDMTICRSVLSEMEKHEDSWPFLKPVNFKQFPSYKKYIKHPMDLATMKNKLRDSVYKTRADFAADMRLIFDNCRTFNEDESEVGKAGHAMRKFFESRWKDILLTITSSLSSREEKSIDQTDDKDENLVTAPSE